MYSDAHGSSNETIVAISVFIGQDNDCDLLGLRETHEAQSFVG